MFIKWMHRKSYSSKKHKIIGSSFSNELKRRLLNQFTQSIETHMTLVYRSSKQQPVKPLHELGPGSYELCSKNNDKNRNNTKSSVFASSSTRDPFDIKKRQKETQQALKSKAKNKQVQQLQPTDDSQQDGSILIKPKKSTDCSHVFNSKVQRFSQQKTNTPEQIKQMHMAQQFKKLLMKEISSNVKGKLLKAKDKLQKQKQIDEDYQVFPSIPNSNTSFGYRYDSETSKWVCNENPNLMEMMLEKEKVNQKINQALGPGCYVYNPNKSDSKHKNNPNQSSKSSDLMASFTSPNLKPKTPIHNSIQEIQHKKKLRIRLLGQSQINKAQQLISNNENRLLGQDLNLEGKNAKQILLLNQMYKKFKNYIPRNDQNSPSKFFQKIKQKKQCKVIKATEPLKLNDISNTHQHFLARSQRFDFDKKQTSKYNAYIKGNQETADQSINNSLLDSQALIHKTYNCKEPYSLGEDRFKQSKTKQNLGPGAYNFDSMLSSSKLPPCLNLKEERFHQKKKKSNIPGPGEYNIAQQLLKKQNNLSDTYTYYKQANNGEPKKHFKRQDSMETLYQTWGRQMNYMVKMQHQGRPQNHEEGQSKQKQNSGDEKSLTQAKKELESQLKKFNTTLNNAKPTHQNAFTNERIISTVQVRSMSQKGESKSPSKIYQKMTKHLYEYKQQPKKDQTQNLGPGKYQTQKDMVKKTFNVTYT